KRHPGEPLRSEDGSPDDGVLHARRLRLGLTRCRGSSTSDPRHPVNPRAAQIEWFVRLPTWIAVILSHFRSVPAPVPPQKNPTMPAELNWCTTVSVRSDRLELAVTVASDLSKSAPASR